MKGSRVKFNTERFQLRFFPVRREKRGREIVWASVAKPFLLILIVIAGAEVRRGGAWFGFCLFALFLSVVILLGMLFFSLLIYFSRCKYNYVAYLLYRY